MLALCDGNVQELDFDEDDGDDMAEEQQLIMEGDEDREAYGSMMQELKDAEADPEIENEKEGNADDEEKGSDSDSGSSSDSDSEAASSGSSSTSAKDSDKEVMQIFGEPAEEAAGTAGASGDVVERPRRTRRASALTRDFGEFHINFREPCKTCKFGAWSTVCAAHKRKGIKCTKSISMGPGLSKLQGLQKLTLWCNQALEYDDKTEHMQVDARPLPCRPTAELSSNKLTKEQIDSWRIASGYDSDDGDDD